MNDHPHLHMFEAYGIELEYMIVDAESLSVLPVADRILFDVAGDFESEVERGRISWSNELVLHVIELKTNGPAASLLPLPHAFQENVKQINDLLGSYGGRLMPTAMHPWMNPSTEMRLWPHEYHSVYETYDRIFDCRSHGWANLQAVHINLPFDGDDEFRRLHAAVRLILPLLPALAASSPIVNGRLTGLSNTRLDVYRSNAAKFPSITAMVIPEPVFSRAEYDRQIFQPMYDDIRPHDTAGVLQHEFLNSRGAIARFDRGSIEIRLLDVQECPAADLAICGAVVEVLRALAEERWRTTEEQQLFATAPLSRILLGTIRDAENTVIKNTEYLSHFGIRRTRCTAGEVWQYLSEKSVLGLSNELPWKDTLPTILEDGPLSRRITGCLDGEPTLANIRHVYGELCDCLAEGRLFRGC